MDVGGRLSTQWQINKFHRELGINLVWGNAEYLFWDRIKRDAITQLGKTHTKLNARENHYGSFLANSFGFVGFSWLFK